jgi:Cdc6-like AAA superfamily ATPase
VDDSFPKAQYRFLETEGASHPPEDELDRSIFAGNLVRLLTSGNLKPPYVFALYGRWGSGKTWVAKQMEHELSLDGQKYPTCWFKAWRYESEQNLMLPLCDAIQKQFGINVLEIDPTSRAQFRWVLDNAVLSIPEVLPTALRNVASVLINSEHLAAILGSLGAFLVIAKIPGAPNWVAGIADIVVVAVLLLLSFSFFRLRRPSLSGWADSVELARGFFKKFIGHVVAKEKKEPLIVFIDDLDRCSPDASLRLLESIKRIALNADSLRPFPQRWAVVKLSS